MTDTHVMLILGTVYIAPHLNKYVSVGIGAILLTANVLKEFLK